MHAFIINKRIRISFCINLFIIRAITNNRSTHKTSPKTASESDSTAIERHATYRLHSRTSTARSQSRAAVPEPHLRSLFGLCTPPKHRRWRPPRPLAAASATPSQRLAGPPQQCPTPPTRTDPAHQSRHPAKWVRLCTKGRGGGVGGGGNVGFTAHNMGMTNSGVLPDGMSWRHTALRVRLFIDSKWMLKRRMRRSRGCRRC